MACNDEDERELRHVAAMVDELCRVDSRERAAAAVMRPAYWRARLDAIRVRLHASGRAAALSRTLVERLDELERRQWRDGASRHGKR
ncbi:hypothetical protein DIE19_05250 [Burkholderia sp. Bp9126]|nr:hypothetical protein DIE19_05250 [Burkholderia sp. Bp9126]